MTSRTGLLASPTKKVTRIVKNPNPNLRATTGPAPFMVKPYAGLYNPYPYGCSLLCNHPADVEARKMLQRAKDNWTADGRSFLFPEEVAAIRAELEHIHTKGGVLRKHVDHDANVESVPEELFRRYTEMDSRPLTPAPTLISAHTRASAARRCITPDPILTSEVREKTLLVLDLRRSHSQETLSWYGSTQQADPPLIRVTHVGTRAPSPTSTRGTNDKKRSPRLPAGAIRRPRSGKLDAKTHLEPPAAMVENPKGEDEEEDGEGMRRRGKRRRKRGRDSSRASVFRTTTDPETLVATIGTDSQNASARPSLVPNGTGDINQLARSKLEGARRLSCLNVDSFLDYEMLRQLRRELNAEIVEFEFDLQRRKALQEALKTVPKVRTDCEELVVLQREINLPVLDTDLWLSLPRMFFRSSSRFELPMDSRDLNVLTPLDYLKEHVWINSTRKLLYNCIFNIYKIVYDGELDDDVVIVQEREPTERRISGKRLPEVLGVLMGGKLTPQQADFFKDLVGWSENEEYDFKVFCGIGALCERILARDFYKKMPDKKLDPCHEVESLDFQSLERRLNGKTADERLVKILHLIRES